MRVLLATRNAGKKREYQAMLSDVGLELVSLDDLGIELQVEETGATFAENARLKARAFGQASGLVTLADDSGLEVDALGGAPGVLSARYAGEGATDRDRYLKLLSALQGTPYRSRTARFRCVIAIAWLDGHFDEADGVCEGVIADEPKGCHGFGYDPVFYLPEFGKTMAELSSTVKNEISHRGIALRAIRTVLAGKLDAGHEGISRPA